MKALPALLLSLLLLCGCTAAEAEPEAAVPVPAAALQAPEPVSLYAPNSQVESRTGEAVRAYPLSIIDANGLLKVGGNLVVLSGWDDRSALTLLSGPNLFQEKKIPLDFLLTRDDPSIQVYSDGFSFFDPIRMQTVIMDSMLNETSRIQVPSELQGIPLLSSERDTLYYCTADSVRAMDLETGISRVLKQMALPDQSVGTLLLEGKVLCCSAPDRGLLFLSTENGQLLGQTHQTAKISGFADRCYAFLGSGIHQELLFCRNGEQPMALTPESIAAACHFLPENHAAVLMDNTGNSPDICLDYYDLETGSRSASLVFEGDEYPIGLESGPDHTVYLLLYDPEFGCDTVYRWDPGKSPTGSTAVCTGPRYTRESPDTEGLALCAQYAAEISQRYGIRVLIYEEAAAVQPWDYRLETEYQVPIILRELEALDLRLSNYPEGFLESLKSRFTGLNICLVRSITGTAESGSIAAAGGLQFWEEYDAYIALAPGPAAENSLYHELCHLIDTQVLSESTAYDRWYTLNPPGFEYDYSFTADTDADRMVYLQEPSRAFIDTYSMTFPKEDRARIMEYAMTPNNECYFQSVTMQNKLLLLCQGIRSAFGLKKSPQTFLWEQYLNISLAYTE